MEKQNRRSSRKLTPAGIVLRIIIVLLCLIVLSVYFMDGLYARYVSNGTGSDSARVAKFDVDVHFKEGGDLKDSVNAEMKYNQATGAYTIVVDNDSEVDIRYDIYIENIQVKVSIDGEEQSITASGISVKLDDVAATAVAAGGTVPFLNAGTMDSNAVSDNIHTLNFLVDWNTFLEDISGQSVSATIDFDVRVDIEQID